MTTTARSRATSGPTASVTLTNPAGELGTPSRRPATSPERHGRRATPRRPARSPQLRRRHAVPGHEPGAGADADLPADRELHDRVDERRLHLGGAFTGASACTNAYNYIHNTGSGTWATSGLTNIVIRITRAPVHLPNGNNDTNTIRGNLAVISDGGFTFSQQSNWNGLGHGEERALHQRATRRGHRARPRRTSPWATTRTSTPSRTCSSTRPAPRRWRTQNNFIGQVLAANVLDRQQVHDDLQGRSSSPAQGT